MSAVVVCGRAKSAPGGAAAPRVRRGPLARESSGAGPGCSPQAPHRASSSTGSPTLPAPSPETAHDPGMSPLCRRLAALLAPVLLVGLAAAAHPGPGRSLTRCPSGSGRSGRRPRWSPGSTLRTHPGAPATAASTCSVPGQAVRAALAGTVSLPVCSLAAGSSSSSTATPAPPTSPSRPPSRSAGVGRGDVIGRLQARRLALSPADVPALGLAARRDLPRPARPGRRRPGPVAAPLARRTCPGDRTVGDGAVVDCYATVLHPIETLVAGSAAGGLRPGVRLLVGPPQPVRGHVGVELGRRQAGVTEQLLHRSQVGSALEQVGGRACAAARAGRCPAPRAPRRAAVHERAHGSLVDPATPCTDGTALLGALGHEAGRPAVSQRSIARAAGWPNGTLRSLRPLPSTRTRLRSRSTSPTSRATSSPTRMPVAYSSSSMAASRIPTGSPSSAGPAAARPAGRPRRHAAPAAGCGVPWASRGWLRGRRRTDRCAPARR